MSRADSAAAFDGIAVIGFSCRLPGSRDVRELWRNLRDGNETISFFSRDELRAFGVDPAVLADPAFVGARGVIADFDSFDAAFFDLSPGEAEALDPQQRIFLECAWEALESAGHDPGRVAGDVAVFAGCGANSYLHGNLLRHPRFQDGAAVLRAMLGNDRDFLATRVSYKLGLRGPSVGVQTACSSSLVAIHLACRALLDYQCDLALAGGVSVRLPEQRGHLYQEGAVFSPDGHCRAFDAAAQGTVGGDGAAVVTLKRLEDALADGDPVYAVVRSTAINNDGSAKLGYTAPGVEGQSAVIATAHALAGVDARTITCVEAHGTGTPLGDPIELAALTRAFRATCGEERGFCALGSIKTNVGHLDTAAGVAGFLKTVLALHHREIPPSLHFTAPNPQLALAESPFYVNTALAPWPAGETPRRAGVSSFGIGGTNAHAVLEEAPEPEPSGPSRPWQLLMLSARAPAALESAARRLAEHLEGSGADLADIADIAFTLQTGRKEFEHRRITVCRTRAEAAQSLAGRGPRRVLSGVAGGERPVAFLFPGQGAQHAGMARGIYESEPAFREQVDRGCERLAPLLGLDLRQVLFPGAMDAEAEARLERTDLAQPALFVVEHALARLWMEWGVRPQAMLGHSLGEYVAACLAGVLSFDDALALVAARGRLMQALPPGAMLAVDLAAEELSPLLAGSGLSLAAENAPARCTVAGPAGEVDALAADLAQRGVRVRRLRTARAFHSALVDPILEPFARELARVELRPPQIPFLSNLTGTWIRDGEAADPGYWLRHLREPVRFGAGVAELLRDPELCLLEVGPGTALGTLARSQPLGPGRTVAASLRHPQDPEPDLAALLTAVGRLWSVGVRIDGAAFYVHERRRRVALPTYPFERRRFWIEPPAGAAAAKEMPEEEIRAELADRFEVPVWRQRARPEPVPPSPASWWIFLDGCGLGLELAARLEAAGGEVVRIPEAPRDPEGCEALAERMRRDAARPVRILDLGCVTGEDGEPLEQALERSFFGPTLLIQALARRGLAEGSDLVVVSDGVYAVTGEERLSPANAALLGPCTVAPQELPGLRCRHLDVVLPAAGPAAPGWLDPLVEEILGGSGEPSLALRGGRWWSRAFEPVRLEGRAGPRLRQGGTWLVTGGLGGVGLALAERLARQAGARLVLVGRRGAAGAESGLKVAALERLGAEVMVAAADVADRERMGEVVAEARRRFGAIHGVIHAAGVPGGGVLEGRSREAMAAVLAPKVQGAEVLASLLAGEDLDAFVLCSSLGGLLGGAGQVDYCAANAFLDAFAQAGRARGARFVSIDWDTWSEAGMAVAARGPGLRGLSSAEGSEAFLRAVAYGAPQVAVSLQSLSSLIRRSREPAAAPSEAARSAHPRPELESGYAAPRNPIETRIAAIWAEVLGLERVGIHDDFSELGGDSLIATQVCSRVRRQLAVDLPLQALFTSPTVAALAAEVARSLGGGEEDEDAVQPRAAGEAPLPLSSAQRRWWFLEQLEPGNPAFHVFGGLRLDGPLAPALLGAALREVALRQEALRTRFAVSLGEPEQIVDPGLVPDLLQVDLGSLEAKVRDGEAGRLTAGFARRPFDLARGPLLRACLLRLGPAEHGLLVALHHVVADGWSMGVFFRDLLAAYRALAEGRPASLPPLPVQYPDFALWQRRRLQGALLEGELAYWRARLAGAPESLDLPADRPRPAVQSYRGASLVFDLPGDLTQALKALGRREGATLFMVLLAGFSALLCRYTGQEDLPVGSPIANRTREELEGLIGFFVNTLVLRVDVAGDPRFAELVRRVLRTTLEAYEHQDLPFERLVEELQPERSLGRQPLFQVLFQLQNAPGLDVEVPGLVLRPLPAPDLGTATFDLTLSLVESEGRLHGTLQYSSDLFDRDRMLRLLGHLETLLAGAAGEPERRLAELPLLTAAELSQVLREWNGPTVEDDGPGLAELILRQVARTPDAAAVRWAGGALTYAELHRCSARLALLLVSRGVGTDVPVAVAAGRSPELLVGVLAVLLAGAACLPLDSSYPAERLAWMLEDSRAGILLEGAEGGAPLADRPGLDRIRLTAELFTDGPAMAGPPPAHPDSLLYLIYTSGSTGRPKGVAVTHRVLAGLVRWQLLDWDEQGGGPAVTLQFSPFSFDVFFQEVFATWAAGGELVLLAEDVRRDPERLLDHLVRERVERIFLPFVALRQLAEAAAGRSPGGLREVITAGEQLQVTPAVAGFFRSLPGARLANQYGPSETHVVTAFPLPGDAAGWDALPPIGRPVAGARIHILDRGLQPVPVGVPGDLYAGGTAPARGYLGRPDLTAERFLPDPFSPAPGGRLYRTGDLARYRAGGEIEFLGRSDDQVKVRGYRVEPGEVEAALGVHPDVRGCAVVARREPGEVRLSAYVVPAEGAGPDLVPALRRFLRGALPDPLVPSDFVVLESLPLTPSGKVDRRKLPAPAAADAGRAAASTAAHGPVEEIVAGVWAEVLGRDGIPRDESFFDLGGHSLLATQVVSRLRRACRVELPVRALFETPTVAALARRIEAAAGMDPALEAPPLERAERGDRLPLSFAQQRIWFLDQLDPGIAAYNIPAALRLRGPLDRGALARAFAAVVRRHEVLRTAFPVLDGEPAQVIGPAERSGVPALPEIDLSGGAGAEALRLLRAESWRPFDLARGPLLRPLLLRLAEQEHLLLVVLHHIVADAWSLAVLLRDLKALYCAPAPLPELPVQYADFAVWQRGWLRGEALARQLAYWQPRLAGAPGLDLPTDRPRPAVQTYRGDALPAAVAPEPWADLRALCRRQGITPFMALLAAFQVLLHRWAGQEDVTVGFPIAGRNRSEIEGLIGCFVNTLALRSRLHGGVTLQGLLEEVRRETFGAYAHQDLPFEKLVEELQPERQVSHSPIFQVLLVLDNVPRRPFELGGALAEQVSVAGGAAKLDLTLALSETGEGLAGAFEYNADLFDGPTVARLRGQLETLLRELGSRLDRPLADLPLLGAAERHQLLLEWGEAPAEPAETCLHRLVELQAAETPDAVAVVDGARRLTYRDLERRSNQLARFLAQRGVGPEVRIGLCLERDAGLVVAMLGVLKAGGAYLPLDPAYPPERLRFMAEDSGAALVLEGGRGAGRLRGVSLETERARIEGLSAEPLRVDVGPENLSHVIYTSGSTGRPKGVAIEHRGSVALLAWARRLFTRAELAGVLAATSISFDLSVFEIFVPLSVGGKVILAESFLHLQELAAAEEVTLVNTVPSVAAEVLRGAGLPRSVRTVNLAGEALGAGLAAEVLRQPGIERLYNLYGPSEDTTYSTWARIGSGGNGPVPIGRPVDGTRGYVLSSDLQPAPPGSPGELYLGGAGLARGYLGRPALTAERFVPDAWSGRSGERLYRTGDLAVYRMDGRLAFLGRLDEQVKVRGFRIELGEIEAALRRAPGIVEAAVVLRPSPGHGEPRLVAYVVPAAAGEDGALDAAELRDPLRGWLPAHMLPDVFVALSALPRTGSGKVDRRALPDPGAAPAPATTYEEPRTEMEQAVARIWRETLGIDRIGLDDNFFELGGHSLLLARVFHRLRPLAARSFPLVALFEHTTVRAIAGFLEIGGPVSTASRQEGQQRGARRRETAERRRQMKGTES